MIIELRRIRYKPEAIDGQIWIEGQRVCDCAENATSALPIGTYPITLVKCKQYSRKMIRIQFTDNSRVIYGNSRSEENPCDTCEKLEFVGNNTTLPVYCPQIKPGNGVFKRLDGSIIVGKYLAPGCLSHPKDAFDTLYQRLRKSAEIGHEIKLTIVSES